MTSIQSQFDSLTVSMEASLAHSHKTLCKMVKDSHEKLAKQMNELIKVVNVLSRAMTRPTDSKMAEISVQDLTGDRPTLLEPQLKKKPREVSTTSLNSERTHVTPDRSGEQQNQLVANTSRITPDPNTVKDVEPTANDKENSPHTPEGAYEMLHLWR